MVAVIWRSEGCKSGKMEAMASGAGFLKGTEGILKKNVGVLEGSAGSTGGREGITEIMTDRLLGGQQGSYGRSRGDNVARVESMVGTVKV